MISTWFNLCKTVSKITQHPIRSQQILDVLTKVLSTCPSSGVGAGWQRFVFMHLLILFSLGHSDPMSKPDSKLYPFNVFHKKDNNTQHFIHLVIFLKSWVQIAWNTGSPMFLPPFFLHPLCSEPIPLFGAHSEVCVGLSTWGQQATVTSRCFVGSSPTRPPALPLIQSHMPTQQISGYRALNIQTNTYYVLEILLGTGDIAVKK